MRSAFFFCYRLLVPKLLTVSSKIGLPFQKISGSRFVSSEALKAKRAGEFTPPRKKRTGIGTRSLPIPSSSPLLSTTPPRDLSRRVAPSDAPFHGSKQKRIPPRWGKKETLRRRTSKGKAGVNAPLLRDRSSGRKTLPPVFSIMKNKKKPVDRTFFQRKKESKNEIHPEGPTLSLPPLTLPSREFRIVSATRHRIGNRSKRKRSPLTFPVVSSSRAASALDRKNVSIRRRDRIGYTHSRASGTPTPPRTEHPQGTHHGKPHSPSSPARTGRVISRVRMRPLVKATKWRRRGTSKTTAILLASSRRGLGRPHIARTGKGVKKGESAGATGSTLFGTPRTPSPRRRRASASGQGILITTQRNHRATSKKTSVSRSSSSSSKASGSSVRIPPRISFSSSLHVGKQRQRSAPAHSSSSIASFPRRLSRRNAHRRDRSGTRVSIPKRSNHPTSLRSREKIEKGRSSSMVSSTSTDSPAAKGQTKRHPSPLSITSSSEASHPPSTTAEERSSGTSSFSALSSPSSPTPLGLRLSEQEVDFAMDQILEALSASDEVASESSFSSLPPLPPPPLPPPPPSPSLGTDTGIKSNDEVIFDRARERPWWLPTEREGVLQESVLNPVGVRDSASLSFDDKQPSSSRLRRKGNEENLRGSRSSRMKLEEASPSTVAGGRGPSELPSNAVKGSIKVVKEMKGTSTPIPSTHTTSMDSSATSTLPVRTARHSVSPSSSTKNERSIVPSKTSPSLGVQPLEKGKKKPSRIKHPGMHMYSSVNQRRFSMMVQDKLRQATEAMGSESMYWITRAQALRTSNALVLPGERPTVIHLDVATVIPLLSLSKATQEELLDNYPPFFGFGVGILSDRNKWKVVTAHRLIQLLNAKNEDRVLYVDTRRADILGLKYKPKDVVDVRKASAVEVYNSTQLDDPYKGEPQRGVALNGITGKRFSQPAHDILLAVGLLRGYISPMWVPERQMKYLNVEIKKECVKDGVMSCDMTGLIVPLSSLPKPCIALLLRLLKRKYPDAFKCDLFFLFGVNQWEASRSRVLVKHMAALEEIRYPYFFVNVQEFVFQFPAHGLELYKAMKHLKPYGRAYIEAAAKKFYAEQAEATKSGKKKSSASSSSSSKKKNPADPVLEVLPSSLLFVRKEKLWDGKEVRCFFAEDATMRRFYNACCMTKPFLLFPSVRAIGILNGRLVGRRDETVLHMHALRHRFSSPLWLTKRMAEKMGVGILYRERKKFAVIGPGAVGEEGGVSSYSEGFYNIEEFSNNEAILSMFPKASKNRHFILDGKWRPVMGNFRQTYLSSLNYSSTLWISMNECLMSGFEPDPSATRHHFPNPKAGRAEGKGQPTIVPIYNSQQTTDPVRVIGLSTFFTRPQGTSW